MHLQRIDLYQLHTPDPKVPAEDSVGELARLQQQGKIRHIGVSNFDLAALKPLQQIAQQRGVSSARVALAWLLARSPAMLPIPGTSSREHLQDDVAAAAMQLSSAELQQLG